MKKQRYLNGRPVFEVGDEIEAFDDVSQSWRRVFVEHRYNKAEIPSGRRSYEYGLVFPDEPGSHMLAGEDYVRHYLKPRGPRVIRANRAHVSRPNPHRRPGVN